MGIPTTAIPTWTTMGIARRRGRYSTTVAMSLRVRRIRRTPASSRPTACPRGQSLQPSTTLNYCTVPTTPPDLNAGVNAPTTWLDEPGLQTIDWQADCFPPDASYPHQPYTCSVPFDITTSVVNTGQGVCTHNP